MRTAILEQVVSTHDIMENVIMAESDETDVPMDGTMDAESAIIPDMGEKHNLMTAKEVARYMGVEIRTIQSWVQKRWLTPRKMSRAPGVAGGTLNGYDIRQVDKLMQRRAEIKTKMEVMQPEDGGVVPRMSPLAVQTSSQPTMAEIVKLIAPAVQKALEAPQEKADEEQMPQMPWREKLYMTIEEAMALTGLGRGYIEQVGKGKNIGPKGRMMYKRSDLEKM